MDAETKKLIQKLQEMKKEVAQKQKKLERAKRAARVRAHVRKKIKEHEANETASSLKLATEDAKIVSCTKSINENKESQQEETKKDTEFEKNSCSISGSLKHVPFSTTDLLPKNLSSSGHPKDSHSKSHHFERFIHHDTVSEIQNLSHLKGVNKAVCANLNSNKCIGNIHKDVALDPEKCFFSDKLATSTILKSKRECYASNCDSPKTQHFSLLSMESKDDLDYNSRTENEVGNHYVHEEKSVRFFNGKAVNGRKSCESLRKKSGIIQSKSHQETFLTNGSEKEKCLSSNELSCFEITNNMKNDGNSSHLERRNGWIDIDFERDWSDFKAFPKSNVTTGKEFVEHQDQNGWLSALKMREVISKRQGYKRSHMESPVSLKSKKLKKKRTDIPNEGVISKRLSTDEHVKSCKASNQSPMSCTTGKENMISKGGNTTEALKLSPNSDSFESTKDLKNLIHPLWQDEGSHLDIDEMKVGGEDNSHSPVDQKKAKEIRRPFAQNHLLRKSENDKHITNSSQLDVKSLPSGSNMSSLWPKTTQELLSPTPSFKTPLLPERENHKSDQRVQHEVTDSEFLHILGIQQSQEMKNSNKNSISIHEFEENISEQHTEHFSTIMQEAVKNPRHENESPKSRKKISDKFRNLDQDKAAFKVDDDTDENATKKGGNKLCLAFDTCLPPSQTLELSDYTDLDSIPVSQYELSEAYFSKNYHFQSTKESAELFMRRRSKRISVAKPFEHKSSEVSASSEYYLKNNPTMQSEVYRYMKGRRQSQAQQRKAAVVLSIFQFLQDKAKEPGSACDFDLTPEFDYLKKKKIENAGSPHAQTSNHDSDNDRKEIINQGYNIQLYNLTSLSNDKDTVLGEKTKFEHGALNVNSNSLQSDEIESLSPLVLKKTNQNISDFDYVRSESLTYNEGLSGKKVGESEYVFKFVDQHNDLGCEIPPKTSRYCCEERHKEDNSLSNHIKPTVISTMSKDCITSPLSRDTSVKHTGTCEPSSNSDNKANSESQKHGFFDSKDVLSSEKAKKEHGVPVSLGNPKVSNDMQHNEKQLCDSPFTKSVLSNKFCVDKKICRSQPRTKSETSKDNTGPQLKVQFNSSTANDVKTNNESAAVSTNSAGVCSDSNISHETRKRMDHNNSAGNIDETMDLKSKSKLNLVSIDSTSLNTLCNISPQVSKEDKVSSLFSNRTNNIASPSNILSSLLSPVTPVVDKATPKNIHSLSRKSISFTSTPIPKYDKRARTKVQKQIEIDFESPVSRSISASSALFVSTDSTSSLGLNPSQDDLMPVYKKALSVFLSPSNAENGEITFEKTTDENDNTCTQSAQTLKLSSNLSLVPVCDESYPSPGQALISDNDSVNISALHDNTDVTCSPYVVRPWKKLARTATTPVQILETETSSCEHSSFSFTSNQLRGKSKPHSQFDIKSNVKFLGCFQSDSQDAVVGLLCGRINSLSHSDNYQAYIVSVKATSLTIWGADDTLGWTTELDWRLCPESHILKACLMPGFTRVAVMVTGWLGASLFASVLTYEWNTEETMRFNIPFQNLPVQMSCLITVEPCPASETQLYLALSSDDHHTVQRTQLSDDQKDLASSDLFQCCRGKMVSLVLVEELSGALISLSYDQRLIIWSCSLGAALKVVSVGAAMPCIQALVSAKAKNGFIFLDSMWRVEDGHCGGLIVMNPLNGHLKVLHTYQVPNNTWRRVDSFKREGQLLSAVGNQGSLCVWDRNTGVLLGCTKSKITTCASVSISEESAFRILVGEIHGCLHIYSSLKLTA